MSRVPSEVSFLAPHHHAARNRAAATEPKQPSSPFSALLGDSLPVPAHDSADAPQTPARRGAQSSASDRPSRSNNAPPRRSDDRADGASQQQAASSENKPESACKDAPDAQDTAATKEAESAEGQPAEGELAAAEAGELPAEQTLAIVLDALVPATAAVTVTAATPDVAGAGGDAAEAKAEGATGAAVTAGLTIEGALNPQGLAGEETELALHAKHGSANPHTKTAAATQAATAEFSGDENVEGDANLEAMLTHAPKQGAIQNTADASTQKAKELAQQPQTEAHTPATDTVKPTIDPMQLANSTQNSVHHGSLGLHAPTAAAHTAATADEPGVPITGLAVEIAARAQSGRNRFEIRLDPPELGRIDVRLDVDRNGHVTSRLMVERAETLDLLRREAPELERALQQAGLKTSDNGLQFTLRDQSFAWQQHQQGQSERGMAQIVVPDAELGPVEVLTNGYGRMLGSASGVDIRV